MLITQAQNVEIKKKSCGCGILGLIAKLLEMSELRSIVKGDYEMERKQFSFNNSVLLGLIVVKVLYHYKAFYWS